MNAALAAGARRKALLSTCSTPRESAVLKRSLQRDTLSSASTASTKVTPEAKRLQVLAATGGTEQEQPSPAQPRALFPHAVSEATPAEVTWIKKYIHIYIYISRKLLIYIIIIFNIYIYMSTSPNCCPNCFPFVAFEAAGVPVPGGGQEKVTVNINVTWLSTRVFVPLGYCIKKHIDILLD